ncbi:hypothetical protein [Salipiger mucosus]|uniref:Uncharacterized protein n=1 Tax=Salipiger mucosus DSM 16094 TaxID=1123237 RepID=S9Q2A6_9RHOB|nr:hypothetical protein [Salipiger mucosus]EPX75421.1 hypothetical protein Salmuc_04763 [Salipiger mucosus DSM 16094]
MPRLVLHAGDCKSGSTAIQSVLQLGSYRFTGDDAPRLHYAQGGRRDGLNHHRLSNSVHQTDALAHRDRAWGRFGQEFAQSGADVVVLSSERFEFAPPQAVRAALEQFAPAALEALSVVIYVRPHAARLLSGYAQNVRQGLFLGDLAEFLEEMSTEGRFHYAARLAAWRETFGEALTVRPMIRDRLTGGCAVQDFLGLCAAGTGAVPLVEKIPNENRSLNPEGLAFMRAFRATLRERNPAPNKQRAAILQRLGGQLEAMPSFSEGRVGIPAALAGKVRAAFAEDAARCDAEVFGEAVMTPALERALETPGAEMPALDSPEVARLRDLSLAWIDMMGRMQSQMARQQRGGQGQGQNQGRPGGGARP